MKLDVYEHEGWCWPGYGRLKELRVPSNGFGDSGQGMKYMNPLCGSCQALKVGINAK